MSSRLCVTNLTDINRHQQFPLHRLIVRIPPIRPALAGHAQPIGLDVVLHILGRRQATGPVFGELAIHTWQVNCDRCAKQLSFEFAVDAKLGVKAQKPAATARIAELGWTTVGEKHLCPTCQEAA